MDESAVSVVYETLDDFKAIQFPSIAVCDLFDKYSVNEDLEKYVAEYEIFNKNGN